MHKELGSWVTLPCHIHLGGALEIIKIDILEAYIWISEVFRVKSGFLPEYREVTGTSRGLNGP